MVVELGIVVQLLFLAEICICSRSYRVFWRKWLAMVFFHVVGVEGRSGGFGCLILSKTGALSEDCSHLRDF